MQQHHAPPCRPRQRWSGRPGAWWRSHSPPALAISATRATSSRPRSLPASTGALWAGRRGRPYVRCVLGIRRRLLGRHPSTAASPPAAPRTSRARRGTAARTSASGISPSVALTTMPTPTDPLPQNSAWSSISAHSVESAADRLARKRAKPAANAGGSTARRSRSASRASSRARREATWAASGATRPRALSSRRSGLHPPRGRGRGW